ncbi:FKBP-type peptidyl-prolyl cis-trans isomerase [Candidatus Babela massiliensis]|uniref:Peptidyl-prolyl cis-trans isomerase n=2 Tax=Candidatus Babela massiliensis TaxID=673862 RepID=V6DJ19_9BACT|nr:FKBP-type peptidyl-prolyl cis-trans isomerase [Candidatus Babela massiliensis]CDK30923.1 FKBP-type peptidyl-prolyl cis-trans isomerase [Candidatus Babela massiliensis]
MKRIFLAVMSVFLLMGCWNTKSNEKSNKIENKKSTNMERQKTSTGLEYEIITPGNGESPNKGQKVTVNYTGWLDNNGQLGTKFDSSVDRNQPFTFIIGVGQVIKGWDEGVMSMKVGEKRRLFIPADLGYGAYGAGRVIPPNAKLIFDVELLKIS